MADLKPEIKQELKQELKPVVVDLDGTLIKTDTLLEMLMALLICNPFFILLTPFWLLGGKANLKNRVAEKVELNVRLLPYNQDVIDYITTAKQKGRRCYLATGTVRKIANAVSEHLGLFEGVLATDEKTNLTGSNKADILNEKFGKGNYIYLGNHAVDLKLWENCAEAIVVSSSNKLLKSVEKVCRNVQQIKVETASIKTYLKAIRVHQWVKNALLFVPLLTSHQYVNIEFIVLCLLGFLSYSLAASSVYVLNDLVDLESDRQHPSKSKRPFAAGIISIVDGLVLFPVLLIVAFSIAGLFLPVDFVLALLIYYVLTVVYSFKLKRIIMLDTIILAALYTMRIIAGSFIIGVELSFWLLAFSMFIFLSLALVKRYTELVLMKSEGTKKAIGRGYHAEDASLVSSFGAASGYIAVMVFALYVNSPEVTELYLQPSILWLACPILLYWISRVWIIAHRGEMNDDPIVFAVKDLQSLITALCIAIVFMAAT